MVDETLGIILLLLLICCLVFVWYSPAQLVSYKDEYSRFAMYDVLPSHLTTCLVPGEQQKQEVD